MNRKIDLLVRANVKQEDDDENEDEDEDDEDNSSMSSEDEDEVDKSLVSHGPNTHPSFQRREPVAFL